jgi:hypothetical protein
MVEQAAGRGDQHIDAALKLAILFVKGNAADQQNDVQRWFLPYFSKFSCTWAASSRVGSRISVRGMRARARPLSSIVIIGKTKDAVFRFRSGRCDQGLAGLRLPVWLKPRSAKVVNWERFPFRSLRRCAGARCLSRSHWLPNSRCSALSQGKARIRAVSALAVAGARVAFFKSHQAVKAHFHFHPC